MLSLNISYFVICYVTLYDFTSYNYITFNVPRRQLVFCKNTYIVDDNMKNICSRQVSRRGSRIDLLRLWSFHLVNQNCVIGVNWCVIFLSVEFVKTRYQHSQLESSVWVEWHMCQDGSHRQETCAGHKRTYRRRSRFYQASCARCCAWHKRASGCNPGQATEPDLGRASGQGLFSDGDNSEGYGQLCAWIRDCWGSSVTRWHLA